MGWKLNQCRGGQLCNIMAKVNDQGRGIVFEDIKNFDG